jgi:hypothetical protein
VGLCSSRQENLFAEDEIRVAGRAGTIEVVVPVYNEGPTWRRAFTGSASS